MANQTDSTLTCGTCPEKFANARSLLEHAQFTHKLHIFQSDRGRSRSPSTTVNLSAKDDNEMFIDLVQSSVPQNNQSLGKSPTTMPQSSYTITLSRKSNNGEHTDMNLDETNNNGYCLNFTNNDSSCSASSVMSSAYSTTSSTAKTNRKNQTFEMLKNIQNELSTGGKLYELNY
jgi:hypothetical protein